MCKAKADGGKRCDCPGEVRNAKRRALDADRKAEQAAATIGEADPVPGQHTYVELCDFYPDTLAMLKTAWTGRDADYEAQITSAQTVVALRNPEPWLGGLPTHIEYDRFDGVSYPKSIRSTDGRQVEFAAEMTRKDGSTVEWDNIHLEVEPYSRNGGKTWWNKNLGVLRNPLTGDYLVYRADPETKKRTKVEGVIGADINEAAAFLAPDERDTLGLPEVFDAEAFAAEKVEAAAPVDPDAGDTAVQVDKAAEGKARAQMMNDLRKRYVSDEAKPDAALEYAAKVQVSRLAALAAGQSSPHSAANQALLHAQAAQRGTSIVGWASGAKQWEKQGRVLKPGAQPYDIWMPIVKPAGGAVTDEETSDEHGDTTGAQVTRMRARRNADGSELVGFKAVKVYDWTQTLRADGQPDPDWSPSIPGGDSALLAKFKASSPLPIVEDHGGNHTGTAHGWTNDRKIVIDPHRSVGSQLSTLAHEMGHVELGHIEAIKAGTKTRAECEQEAQLVAYQVIRGLGLGNDADEATTQATADYLRNWQKADGTQAAGHKQRWKLLQDRITPASDAAHKILARFYGLGAEQGQAKAA